MRRLLTLIRSPVSCSLLALMAFLASLPLCAEDRSAESSLPGTTAAASATASSILDDDPADLLGLTLADSFSRFGPPTSVGAVRGDAAWQDDVAFLYSKGYTLFFYGDRVWQLRLT